MKHVVLVKEEFYLLLGWSFDMLVTCVLVPTGRAPRVHLVP